MYHIVMATDNSYAEHAATLIASIGAHTKAETMIHVLDNQISSDSREKLRKLETQFRNISISFHEVNDDMIRDRFGGFISGNRSLTAYARLFIPKILPDDVEQAVYLDVDAVLLDDIEIFFAIDLGNYLVGGVMDANPLNRHRNIGLNDNDIYINSGVIVWNLKECRKQQICSQFIAFVKQHNGVIDAMDQGTLNGVLSTKIMLLPPRYNMFTALFQMNQRQIQRMYCLPKYYDNSEIQEGRRHPLYVHFTPNLTTRPWVEGCKHPFMDEYWKYRNMTEFKGRTLDLDRRTTKQKLISFLFYHLPFRLFLILIYHK